MSAGPTRKDIEVEAGSLIDQIIRHDQSLTPEQRAHHRRGLSLSHFEESARRILRLLKLNAPDPIIANAVSNLYSRAWSLWEEDMGRELLDRIKHEKREQSNRCVSCGIDLPYPIDPAGASLCAACTIADDEFEDPSPAPAPTLAGEGGPSPAKTDQPKGASDAR